MKKFLLTAVMGVLFCIGLTSMVNLSSPKNHESLDCKELCASEELGEFFSNKGQCMSFCKVCTNPSQSTGNTAVCICKLVDAGVIEDDELQDKNFGQCVKTVKGFIND
jgi:hypothetical protein